MNRHIRYLFAIALCLLVSPLLADDSSEGETEAASKPTLLEQVKEQPDNAKLLNQYFLTEFRAIGALVSEDVDAAATRLDELKSNISELEPTDRDAVTLLKRGQAAIAFYSQRIELARTSLEELAAKLSEKPDNAQRLSQYVSKVSLVLGPIMESDPDKASEQLASAKTFISELKDKTEDAGVSDKLDSVLRQFSSIERRIATKKRQIEVIGEDAAPLKIDAWVNGDPLQDGDLKGKVVLLDFWAVWCGPCIASFPNLREWHETYADKGLVIIGLTDYYGYKWDDEAGRAVRQKEEVPEEAEQQMLTQFAKEHDLKHRFAVTKSDDLSNFYGVSGIPHMVVIDQMGKVRLIKVGSGPATAKEIGALLAELLN